MSIQIISLVNKGVNAKSSDAEYEELPQGSCGMRRVTQMLRNGGGKYLNKDILKFSGGVRRNAQDDMVDSMLDILTLYNTFLMDIKPGSAFQPTLTFLK